MEFEKLNASKKFNAVILNKKFNLKKGRYNMKYMYIKIISITPNR